MIVAFVEVVLWRALFSQMCSGIGDPYDDVCYARCYYCRVVTLHSVRCMYNWDGCFWYIFDFRSGNSSGNVARRLFRAAFTVRLDVLRAENSAETYKYTVYNIHNSTLLHTLLLARWGEIVSYVSYVFHSYRVCQMSEVQIVYSLSTCGKNISSISLIAFFLSLHVESCYPYERYRYSCCNISKKHVRNRYDAFTAWCLHSKSAHSGHHN